MRRFFERQRSLQNTASARAVRGKACQPTAASSSRPGRDVHLQGRAEGPSGIGDAYHTVRPGEKFLGISYAEFKAAGSGVVIVEHDGAARIEKA